METRIKKYETKLVNKKKKTSKIITHLFCFQKDQFIKVFFTV